MLPLVLFPKGVRGLVEFLEECVIQTSLSFGVVAGRDPINAGVWCNDRKIAAVGLRVKEHVTLHGLAFNLVNSLETFGHIIPCGLASRGVTSLSLEFYHEKKKCSDWMPERNLTFEQGSQVFVAKMKELLPLYGAASLDSQKTQLSQSRVSSSATL
jgi:lipoate-protein ligase B